MAVLGKRESGPIASLRDHMAQYMNWVRLGRSKFRKKKEIGKIFIEMDSSRYLFEQAMGGSMYDYQKKIERNVWAGALHKYDKDMKDLKDALVRALDACDASKMTEEEAKEDLLHEDTTPEVELSVREQMELADKKEQEEAERAAEEKKEEAEEEKESEQTEAMTEADCRELWRIYQGMNKEYKEMKRVADGWFADHPEKGCLGITLMVFLVPLGAIYGLYELL